jgi:hypothetical protein
MLSIHLRLGLPSGLFPSGFPTNNLYMFLTLLLVKPREFNYFHISQIVCIIILGINIVLSCILDIPLSETGFPPRLHVAPVELGPIERSSSF